MSGLHYRLGGFGDLSGAFAGHTPAAGRMLRVIGWNMDWKHSGAGGSDAEAGAVEAA